MKRRLIDRLHDRAWREAGRMLSLAPDLAITTGADHTASSVSSVMPWADICREFAERQVSSANFRRYKPVRDVVETVGPVDGAFYAGRIREWQLGALDDPVVRKIDRWGSPIRWPGALLGTSRAFSPTTLRYLATALWLKQSGLLAAGVEIVEIGVGFGGLAAMNGLLSGASTILVDLPQVELTALRMLEENQLVQYARGSDSGVTPGESLVVSNYAFTELNKDLQNRYFHQYIRNSGHGIIVSNSAVFAESIRGRSDAELVDWFRSEGLDAKIDTEHELLAPGDHLCGVSLIRW